MTAGAAIAQDDGDAGPPDVPSQPVWQPVPDVAQDQVGLSFSNVKFADVAAIEPGSPVTIYLLAFLADRTEEIDGFSCRVEWNGEAISGLAWQAPAQTGRDGLVAATFTTALLPEDGCVVLATAVGQVLAPGDAVVRLVGTPVIASTANLARAVPLGDRLGRRLSLREPDAEDLGPPGATGKPEIR